MDFNFLFFLCGSLTHEWVHHAHDKTILKFDSDSLQEDQQQDFLLLSKTILQVSWEVYLLRQTLSDSSRATVL